VAEALEELCGNDPGARVGELARHWIAATQPIDLAKAIGYSRQAGDAALSALAPADALRHYAQALDLYSQADGPDPALGLDLAIGLGTAQRQTGNPAFRGTLLDAARGAAALGDTGRLVGAVLANDRGWYSSVGVIDADKVAVLELALDHLPGSEPDRALLLANLCTELTYGSPLGRRQDLAREALVIAEASGDEVVAVRVFNHICYPLYVPQLLDQLLDRTADALIRAESVGDSMLQFWATYWRACVAPLAGDIDELDRCSAIMESLVEKLDQPMLRWSYLIQRTHRALIAGETDEAEQLATDCFQVGNDSGQPDASTIFAMHLLGVNGQRGTSGDLIPVIEEIRTDMRDISKAAVESALAIAYVEGGRLDDARQVLGKFADGGFELPYDTVWLLSMATYADVAVECEDRRAAGPLFELLAPWADQLSTNGGGSTNGPVSHFLGGLAALLGRYDEADSYFARAAAFNERARAKFFAAQTDLLWGRMLVERGATSDAERARDLLERSQAAARAFGYGGVERRSTVALGHLG
jgi:tetratricopeptide (TPR) repeat protein